MRQHPAKADEFHERVGALRYCLCVMVERWLVVRVALPCLVLCLGVACQQFNPDFDRGQTELGDEDEGTDDEVGADIGSEGPTSETDTTETGSPDTEDTESTEDTETDTTETGEELCEAPAAYVDCDTVNQGLVADPFLAIGLNCLGPDDQTIQAEGLYFSPGNDPLGDPDSWRIVESFGEAEGDNHGGKRWAAREGKFVGSADPGLEAVPPNTSSAILVLTTGKLQDVDAEGALYEDFNAQPGLGPNSNVDLVPEPEPISPELGSNDGMGGTPFQDCDGVNDCSDSLYQTWVVDDNANFHDQLFMRFTVTPPEGVHGYLFDFAFFSSEHPTYLDTAFNDTFVAWSSSESYTGNLTFVGQAPLSTTALEQQGAFQYVGESPALAGTGFETHAATPWLLARGPAIPGEPVQLTLFLADVGDALFASVVLLDNFRWDCGGCVGGGCGFNP